MHFCRARMHESHLGLAAAYLSQGSRSGEGAKPSYDGPVSPTGPEFPQALLISRRPVIPPDRAPFFWSPGKRFFGYFHQVDTPVPAPHPNPLPAGGEREGPARSVGG